MEVLSLCLLGSSTFNVECTVLSGGHSYVVGCTCVHAKDQPV